MLQDTATVTDSKLEEAIYIDVLAGGSPRPPTRTKRPGFRVGYARDSEERHTPPPLPAAQPPARVQQQPVRQPARQLGQQPQTQTSQLTAMSWASSTAASEHASSAASPQSPKSPAAPVSAMGAPPPRLRQSGNHDSRQPARSASAQLSPPALQPTDLSLTDPSLDWAVCDSVADTAATPLQGAPSPPPSGTAPLAKSASAAAPGFNLLDESSLQVSNL